MSTIKSRLREVMAAVGLKPYSLHKCPGITRNMEYHLWASETDTVTSNILGPFCDAYPLVNCNWLIRGTGPMFINDGTLPEATEDTKRLLKLKRRIESMGKTEEQKEKAYDFVFSMLDLARKSFTISENKDTREEI